MALGVLQTFPQFRDLPRQRVDLEPLCRDGLVQRLDGLVLVGQTYFQRIDPLSPG